MGGWSEYYRNRCKVKFFKFHRAISFLSVLYRCQPHKDASVKELVIIKDCSFDELKGFKENQALNKSELSVSKKDVEGLLSTRLESIFGFAVKRTYDRAEAEDLTQEIIVEIYRSFSAIKNAAVFDSWMWKLAHNTWCRWLTRKKKGNLQFIEGMINPESIVDNTLGFEEKFIERETLDSLRWQIGCLSRNYRDIIILHYMMDKKCEEISKVLSIPKGTVRRQLCEARTKLKEGMNNMKDFGEKSYMPGRLITNVNGSIASFDPNSLFERILPQNIALAAYNKAVTIQELSRELGVSGVYLEDEINLLVDGDVLTKVGKDRYQTDFVIVTKDIRQRLDPIIQNFGQKLTKTMYNELKENENKIRSIGFDGCDKPWEELVWVLFPFMIFIDDIDKISDKWKPVDLPLRPGGDRWWLVGFEGTRDKNPYMGGRAVKGDFNKMYIAAMYSNKYSPLNQMLNDVELSFCARFMDGGLSISEMDEKTRELAAGLIARGILKKDSDKCKLGIIALDQQESDVLHTVINNITEQYHGTEVFLDAIHNELEKTVPSHLKGQLYSPTIFSFIEAINCGLDILVSKGIIKAPKENEPSTRGMYLYVNKL